MKIQLIEEILKEENNIDQALKNKMEEWFDDNILKRSMEKTYSKYPNSIFYVDKNTNYIYLKYDEIVKYLFVDEDKIWSYFKSNYSNNDKEIEELIKDLVGKHLGLWDISVNINLPVYL